MFGDSYHCFPDTSEGLSDLHPVNKQCRTLGVAEQEGEAGTSKPHRV